MNFITVVSILLFAVSPAFAQDADTRVAKVKYSEIQDLIESVVLSQPENKDLGERFRAKEVKSQQQQKKMQQAIMKGEKFNPLDASFGVLNKSRERKQVAVLCEKKLLETIEKSLGDKYHVILKDDFSNSLLFTKAAIDDVTLLLKQELLKQLPAAKN